MSTAVRPHPALYFIAVRQMAPNKRETQWRIQLMLLFYLGPMKVGKWTARYLPDEMTETTEICRARNFSSFHKPQFGTVVIRLNKSFQQLDDDQVVGHQSPEIWPYTSRSYRGDLSPKSMKIRPESEAVQSRTIN